MTTHIWGRHAFSRKFNGEVFTFHRVVTKSVAKTEAEHLRKYGYKTRTIPSNHRQYIMYVREGRKR